MAADLVCVDANGLERIGFLDIGPIEDIRKTRHSLDHRGVKRLLKEGLAVQV